MAPPIKLKGEVWEMQKIPELKNIVQIYSKQVGKPQDMIIKFTRDHVYLISESDATSSSVKIWTEVPTDDLFHEYEFSGLQPTNQLFVKTSCENLSDALKSIVTGVKILRIRLRPNRNHPNRPTLTFEYEQGTNIGGTRTTKKSIDVELLHPKDWNRHEEPSLPPFDICCVLPPLIHLKSFVDKCKGINKRLEIVINSQSQLELKVGKESLEIVRHFRDVIMEEADARLVDKGEVSVDIKRLHNFLRVLPSVFNNQIYCKIVHEKYAHFSFLADRISVQFILPHFLS